MSETKTPLPSIADAHQAICADYYRYIRRVAQDLAEEVASGELADPIALDTALHETADGAEYVIYTGKTLDCLRASDNWLEIDDIGLGDSKDLITALTQAAYFAVRADLTETLRDVFDCDPSDFDRETVADALRAEKERGGE